MTEADHDEIWDRFEAGDSLTAIGEAIGRNLTTVRSYIYRHNSRRPQPDSAPAVWSDHRLSLADREEISRGLVRGDSFRKIAGAVGRAPSTVSREVNRNGGRECYRAVTAEADTRDRACRPRQSKLVANPDLAGLVATKLEVYWSPEQIAGWLRLHHSDDPSMRVCHESIYVALYDGNLAIGPKDCLRTKRPRRRRRYRRSNNGEGVLKNLVLIRHRPDEINARAEFGHWESQ